MTNKTGPYGVGVILALLALGNVPPAAAALVRVVVTGVYTQTSGGDVPAGLNLEPGVTPMETVYVYDSDAITVGPTGIANGDDAMISMATTIGGRTFGLSRATGALGRVRNDQVFGPLEDWQYQADMFGAGAVEPNFIAVYMSSFFGSIDPFVPYVPASDAPFAPPIDPGNFSFQVLSFDQDAISVRDGIEGSILSVTAAVVPIPAGAWLFISALCGLPLVRRASIGG